ncbi:hypothetical protein [Lentzea sp. NBRC 102530]|uniref:hypothetical protein n=1 Tax=Lentzea sp. NBRC 102530 TaxID=3032201 RepID=UPI0024A0A3EE|nr:hypothetical protein [Lentzea sp. NBRC 102530]GLY54894.1 hypothetical protein Lesp01_85490 [Lentzea sp. NBRC 102530]
MESVSSREAQVDTGESPVSGDVPFWVTACLLFMPPTRPDGKVIESARTSVFPVVQALTASLERVQDDLYVRVNQRKLAILAGYKRPDDASWIFEYLQKIQFLQILDGGRDKKGRRQARRDPATGRKIDHLYRVFRRPPANYTGPKDYAELDIAVRGGIDDADAAASEKAGKPTKARSVTLLPRNLFRDAPGQPNPANAGKAGEPFPAYTGKGDIPPGQPNPANAGKAGEPFPAYTGKGDIPPGQPYPVYADAEEEREGTSLSGGSLPRSIEGGTAAGGSPLGATAAAVDEELDTAARALPWLQRGWRPSAPELRRLVAAMTRARLEYGYTVDELVDHARYALAERRAQSPGFVIGAFEDDRLPARLLPARYTLPQTSGVDHQTPIASPEMPADASTGMHKGDHSREPQIPGHCGECGNTSLGESNPAIRDVRHRITFDRVSGQNVPCTCHPNHPDQQARTTAT